MWAGEFVGGGGWGILGKVGEGKFSEMEDRNLQGQ